MSNSPQGADLVIANGDTTSTELGTAELGHADGVWFYGPATLPETVYLEASYAASGDFWHRVTSGGSDVAVGAGKAVPVTSKGFARLRLKATGAVAGSRTFKTVLVNP